MAVIDVDRYLILVEGGPSSNYSAWSPDVRGCVSTGATVDECVDNMRDALRFHLEGMGSDAAPPPEPTGPGVYVERSAIMAA